MESTYTYTKDSSTRGLPPCQRALGIAVLESLPRCWASDNRLPHLRCLTSRSLLLSPLAVTFIQQSDKNARRSFVISPLSTIHQCPLGRSGRWFSCNSPVLVVGHCLVAAPADAAVERHFSTRRVDHVAIGEREHASAHLSSVRPTSD